MEQNTIVHTLERVKKKSFYGFIRMYNFLHEQFYGAYFLLNAMNVFHLKEKLKKKKKKGVI